MNFLEGIIEYKRNEIPNYYKKLEYINRKKVIDKKISFSKAVYNRDYLTIIAEIKRKSPSVGILDEKDNPVEIAKTYYKSGVNAISVLTDEKYFNGSYDFIEEISKSVNLPLLCKDFIIDRVQIDLALASGANAVLLISEILDDKLLLDLYEYACKNNIDVLLEAHYKDNIIRALQIKPKIIGINNRNLKTLEVDYKHCIKMREYLTDDVIKLSLSGINNKDQAIEIAKIGYDGILIGTSVMRSNNKFEFLNSFQYINKYR